MNEIKKPSLEVMPYQRQAIDFIKSRAGCGLFLDVGLGKTATVLQFLYEENAPANVLIIAPKNIALSTWPSEIEKWNFPFRYVSIAVNEKGKKRSPKDRERVLRKILDTKQPYIYLANREIIAKIVNFYTKNNLPWPFPIVIIDELQSFKSASSERFKALKKVRPQIARFIGMTGTPIPNGMMDLWSEIYLMDKGYRLGDKISKYRENYFYSIPHTTESGRIYYDYEIIPYADRAIWQNVDDIVISMSNKNIKLPPVTFNDVKIKMTADEIEMYKTFAKEYVLSYTEENEQGEHILEAKNAAILSSKLRQLASGTIYTNRDGENPDEDKDKYITLHEHKLKAVEEIARDTDGPLLVCYHFRAEADAIMNYFDGEVHDGEKRPRATVFESSRAAEMVDAWNRGEYEMMLIQPAAAGHGLNLQHGGHTLVWYTLSWSLEEYLQANGRLARTGQTKPVVIHRLLTSGTIDLKVLAKLGNKSKTQAAFLDAVALENQTTQEHLTDEQIIVSDTIKELLPDLQITHQR